MSLYSTFSKWTFQALRIAEATTGLPKSIADTLHFRRTWRQYIRIESRQPTLWIHGASVGELEDLANFFLDPVCLKLSGYNSESLIFTSSSASAEGFLRRFQNQKLVLYAGPLPPEDLVEIRSFLSLFKPDLLLLSHSDIWPLLMETAQNESLRTGIVWLPAKANAATHLFENVVQPTKLRAVGLRNEDDRLQLQQRLSKFPGTQLHWIGNARLERIQTRIQNQRAQDHHVLEVHRSLPDPTKVSLMIGSAWPEDAAVLGEALNILSPEERARFQIVVLPHVTDDMHKIASIQHLLPTARVLAVQGVLLEAYQDFDLAFVGGGFRTGLHNVLEPILWSIPVACGPLLKKQPEASGLAEMGALFPVTSAVELSGWLRHCLDAKLYGVLKEKCHRASIELTKSIGAAKRLSELIRNISLETES